MAARTGMANLIKALRAATMVGAADYTINSVAYWTDEQLQEMLDRYQEQHVRLDLQPMPVYTGAWEYYEYLIPAGSHFEESGTDSGWAVRDLSGGTVSGYTANYAARKITFTADQKAAVYTLDCRSYSLNQSAAEVWDWKAANVAAAKDWASDNHSVKAGQEYEHCVAMAAEYRKKSGVRTSRMFRIDEVWGN